MISAKLQKSITRIPGTKSRNSRERYEQLWFMLPGFLHFTAFLLCSSTLAWHLIQTFWIWSTPSLSSQHNWKQQVRHTWKSKHHWILLFFNFSGVTTAYRWTCSKWCNWISGGSRSLHPTMIQSGTRQWWLGDIQVHEDHYLHGKCTSGPAIHLQKQLVLPRPEFWRNSAISSTTDMDSKRTRSHRVERDKQEQLWWIKQWHCSPFMGAFKMERMSSQEGV